MADVTKHLDRAKKFLEKNRVEDAIEAYLSVLEEAPSHMEATQALGDLYARREQPDRAAIYYGMFFDLLVDPKDETKALAIYNRFLKHSSAQQQPPERIARYAFLQQKQNRTDEASEQYAKAADLFTAAGREEDALFCLERIAQIEPDNLGRQVKLADVAEKMVATCWLRGLCFAPVNYRRPAALPKIRWASWPVLIVWPHKSEVWRCSMPQPACVKATRRKR